MNTIAYSVVALVILIFTSSCVDCDGIKEEASELKASYEKCSKGDDCIVVDLYEYAGANNCLGAFQCSAAFNADSDMDSFGDTASQLAEDFEQCDECTMAGCMDPAGFVARCNTEEGRCVLAEVHYPSDE